MKKPKYFKGIYTALHKKHSINFYVFLYIVIFISVFVLSSWLAVRDFEKMQAAYDELRRTTSHNDLSRAIQSIIDKHQQNTLEFAMLDEVQQQIDNPQFYAYWYTHRLSELSILPENVVDVSIYNHHGDVLDRISVSTMPEKITTSRLQPYFVLENGTAWLITTEPVKKADQIIGYCALKTNFIEELLLVSNQFIYIDTLSLQFKEGETLHVDSDQLIYFLDYTIINNKETGKIIRHLISSLLRNAAILIVFAIVFYFLLHFFLSKPLLYISQYIDELKREGNLLSPPQKYQTLYILELDKIVHSLFEYQQKLLSVYENLDRKNKQLWHTAHYDDLTGLQNRCAFEEKIQELDASPPQKIFESVSLIIFDINHFKSINDSYGHQLGNEVLKQCAWQIAQSFNDEAMVYRIAGDEFAVLAVNLPQSRIQQLAEDVSRRVTQLKFDDAGMVETIRLSMGIAHLFRADGDEPEKHGVRALLWQADTAMYQAKKPGNQNIITYTPAMKRVSNTLLSRKNHRLVFDAIDSGIGIVMHYQPIIENPDGRVAYYEALLRIHDGDEMVSPAVIFSLVEDKKLEHLMDMAIFQAIYNDLQAGKIPRATGVSINISGPSIVHPQIVEQLQRFVPFLQEYKIVLEITETSLITNIERATEKITELRKCGFLVALDDFGSGYSSISYLLSMPVDIVKFDITLIRQLQNPKQQNILRYLAMMILEADKQLVAEGIEDVETERHVLAMRFNYSQGFLYGKPQVF